MTIPGRLTVELDEQDVQQDLHKIISAMGLIRNEQLTKNGICDENKNEYLHLTYRLASAIGGLADIPLLEKTEGIFTAIDNNPALLSYDYLQDAFWRNTEREFTESLDRIVIALQKDYFTGLEDKHHVFNALKFLGSTEEPFETRMQIYDTILPFNNPTSEHNRVLFTNELKKNKISADVVDGLTLVVKEDKDLGKLIKTAAHLGFKDLKTITDDYEIVKKQYPEIEVLERFVPETKLKRTSQKLSRLDALKSIALHYIMGNASYFVQKNLEERFGEEYFKPKSATKLAFSVNLFSATANLLYTGLSYLGDLNLPCTYPKLAAVLFLSEVMRSPILLENNEMYNQGCFHMYNQGFIAGNMPGTILFSPLSMYYHLSKNKHQHWIKVPLSSEQDGDKEKYLSRRAHTNFIPFLEDLAQKQLPKVEDNLRWALENHYTQGNYFTIELFKKAESNSFKRNEYRQRESSSMTFYDISDTGLYKKIASLTCFPDQRYVLSVINKDSKIDFDALTRVLSTQKSVREKSDEISSLVNAEYLHLIKFEHGEKTDEHMLLR